MHRLTLLLSLAASLSVAAGAARAAVDVNVAVRPDSIPQCGTGHLFFQLANTGREAISVRVCIALVGRDSVIFGPMCGRTMLRPGERRMREFDFRVPAFARPGRYAFIARAVASDGTSDQSVAPFVVVPAPESACRPASIAAESLELTDTLLQGTGLDPDEATPAERKTWGELKTLYR